MSYHVKRTVIYQPVVWYILCYTACKIQCDITDCFFKKNFFDYFASLKLVSSILLYFTERKHFKNYGRAFLFHPKSSFSFLTYSIFWNLFPSSPWLLDPNGQMKLEKLRFRESTGINVHMYFLNNSETIKIIKVIDR